MAKIIIVIFLLIPLFLVSCDDSGRNCRSNRFVDLLVSTCPAETIIQSCNGWFCQNINNPDDHISLSSRNFECEVIDCDFLSCIDIETNVVTDFTEITPLFNNRFSTLLNSDVNEEYNCGLTVP